MSSVVIVRDVSTMVKASDVNRIRYCGSCVNGVSKTQNSVLFIGCVGYVDGKTKKKSTVHVVFICNEICWQKNQTNRYHSKYP